jgi:homocysteine S-methyltransferase
METSFLDALDRGPLVFDGAIGTQLYERGIYINKSFDHANLYNANLVRTVHEEYLDAGADVLTTNTFSANRLKLKEHGLEEDIAEINHRGVEIAREAASDTGAFVAGSIGPTGLGPVEPSDETAETMRNVFLQQVGFLADAGVDLLTLETFRHIDEIEIALEAVRQEFDGPIVAHMAFDEEHETADGTGPEAVAHTLDEWGADVVGANCMEGPSIIFDVVEEMVEAGLPVSAQPNAGYPRQMEDRLVYMATPEYFGVYGRRFLKLGCAMVGGCCGTGPQHIEKISGAARMMGGGRVTIEESDTDQQQEAPPEGVEPTPPEERSEFASKIMRVWRDRVMADPADRPDVHRDNFAVSVEVNPPTGLDPSDAIESAQLLLEGGADVLNTSDGPRAKAAMSNLAFGRLMSDATDNEIILHVCGRDRNLLGMQSHLLGAHGLGLNNLCVITGDPPKVGDYPNATAVFDLDSIGILRMVNNLNHGLDPAGKEMDGATSFFSATGAEPGAQDYEREIKRLEKKKEAGANFVMTQPVYDPKLLEQFLSDIEHIEIPVLVGLLPLASYRNAEFLHNEVPGMDVPQNIRDRMEAVGSGPEARREGVEIAQETLMNIRDEVVGAYFMPPFGRHEAALEILEVVPGYTQPHLD